jgi:hypothetical protein
MRRKHRQPDLGRDERSGEYFGHLNLIHHELAFSRSRRRPPAALRFSECMRANGVPDFPDPRPGGGFDIPTAANPGSPGFRSAQAKCQKILSAGGGLPAPGGRTDPTSQTLTKLLRIAVCMRRHGISQFPDPRTSVPSDPLSLGVGEISDFDGAILLFPQSLNMQAPAYRQALTACGAPPLGLPH